MAEFQTFDLGRVIQTAEAIKGMRRQETIDKLQEQYLGQRIDAGKQEMERSARAEQVVIGKEKAEQIVAKTGQILQQPQDVKGYVEKYEPDLVKNASANGFDWATADDNKIREYVTSLQNRANQELGVAPAPKAVSAYTLKPGERRFEDDKVVASVAPNQTDRAPVARWTTIGAQDLARYNLPPGTTAQVNDQTGEVKVISKKDASASLSQKDATTAKLKVNQIGVALGQLDRAMDRFSGIKDTFAAGPGSQVLAMSPQRKGFQAAIDQLRNLVTAVQRVPGVGSMSDYETKLQQLVFPDAGELESVTLQKMQDLRQQLTDVLDGYQTLLSGETPTVQAAGGGGWTVEEVQ